MKIKKIISRHSGRRHSIKFIHTMCVCVCVFDYASVPTSAIKKKQVGKLFTSFFIQNIKPTNCVYVYVWRMNVFAKGKAMWIFYSVIFSPPFFSNSTKPILIPLLPALSTYFSVSSLFVGIPAAFYVHNFQDYLYVSVCKCVYLLFLLLIQSNVILYVRLPVRV